MSQPPASPSPHTEATEVFALITKEKRFLSLIALPEGREWVYGFTSLDKAKDFVRATLKVSGFPEIVSFFPCTLAEWFVWERTKGHFPLALDIDAHALLRNPRSIVADTAKFDVQSVVQNLPGGSVHIVTVTPRVTHTAS